MVKNNKNLYLEEDISLYAQFEDESGKKAIWKGKVTAGFKDWKDELLKVEQEAEIEVIEAEDEEEAKEPKVDRKQIISDFMSNNNKWYSHRCFTEIGLNGRQVRPHLVKLLEAGKLEQKTESRRNYYKLI